MAHHVLFPQMYFSYKQERHLEVKQRLLEKYDVSSSDSVSKWNCNSTCIDISPDEILPVITPALRSFGKEIQKSPQVFVTAAWINFYRKGAFQEVHNHVGNGCQLALVYFVNYNKAEDGKFYFYNTNTEIESADLPSLFNGPLGTFGSVVSPNVAEGDVLIFPSYLHHGVSPHNGENLRVTVSCNLTLRLTPAEMPRQQKPA